MISKKSSLCEISEIFKNKKIFCFGAGEYGVYWYHELTASGLNIMGFIDNDIEKQKKSLCGLTVYSVEELNQIKDNDTRVLITVKSPKTAERIMLQLEEESELRCDKELFFFEKLENESAIEDETFLQILSEHRFGKKLNLKDPKTFNEKLQWLKLHDRKPIYTQMADKYEARKYITRVIGDEYLVPLLGVWDNCDGIDFDKLPRQFVLKCTHDSGSAIICKDKGSFDIEAAKLKLNDRLRKNYYWNEREWQYKNIEPKIIAEAYLEDAAGELFDYKLMCFNGKVKCTYVRSGQGAAESIRITFFDNNWNRLHFCNNYPNDEREFAKPANFKKMIEIAEKLSKDISYLRVDFYEVKQKLYIGEMTFHEYAGNNRLVPEIYNEILGSWIKL